MQNNVVTIQEYKQQNLFSKLQELEQKNLEFQAKVEFKENNNLSLDAEIEELTKEFAEYFHFTEKEKEILQREENRQKERMTKEIHVNAPDIPIAKIMYYLPILYLKLNAEFNDIDRCIEDIHNILSDSYIFVCYEKYNLEPVFDDFSSYTDEEFISMYKELIFNTIDEYGEITELETANKICRLFSFLTEYGHRDLSKF